MQRVSQGSSKWGIIKNRNVLLIVKSVFQNVDVCRRKHFTWHFRHFNVVESTGIDELCRIYNLLLTLLYEVINKPVTNSWQNIRPFYLVLFRFYIDFTWNRINTSVNFLRFVKGVAMKIAILTICKVSFSELSSFTVYIFRHYCIKS